MVSAPLTRGAIALSVLLALLAVSLHLAAQDRPTGANSLRITSSGAVTSDDYPARSLVGAWCAEPGLGDRPVLTFGPSTHVVYSIPADAPDRFQDVGPSIAADIEAIEAWWRRQDPGRAVRFDRYAASCGAQLDVTLARLPEDTRYYSRFAFQGEMIDSELADRGLDLDRRINLVYYDGPAADADVCGEAGGIPDETGRIIVFLQNCTDRDRSRIVAHEILHALGALPPGAPNACPGDDGHPCDGTSDVLFPKVDVRPLEAMILDEARNDYYGHRGSWYDLRDSGFLRRLDVRDTRLAVTISGAGRVSNSSLGLDCASRCVTRRDGRLEMSFEPNPEPGCASFVGRAPARAGAVRCSSPAGRWL